MPRCGCISMPSAPRHSGRALNAMPTDMPTGDDAEQLRREISRYPTNLGLYLQLGAALSKRCDYSGAIPELQKAMLSPHARLQAMRLLVEAYQGSG